MTIEPTPVEEEPAPAPGLIVARREAGALIALCLGLIGALAGFVTIGAFPLWSVITITVDVLMVWR